MAETDEPREYEIVVVGGGSASLQTVLYTTRLDHDTALVNRSGGHTAMMLDTHNVIGVTEGTSGSGSLETARDQLEDYGIDIRRDSVADAERLDDGQSRLVGNKGGFVIECVVLGVGFNGERPELPLPCTSRGLHYCLHCDAYTLVDESMYVMGHSDSAACVTTIMFNFTDEVDLLLRGDEPTWSNETDELIRVHSIDIVEKEFSGITKRDDGWPRNFELEDGAVRKYRGGFAMYSSDYSTTLFEAFDVDPNDDGTVPVDNHDRTGVDGAFAIGDIAPGRSQVPVVMDKGAKTGIVIHMELREFPRSLDEIRAEGTASVNGVPGISPSLLDRAKQFNKSHADDQDRNLAESGENRSLRTPF